MACSIKAPDDVILAALAIKEAYDIAYDIVMHNEEPNTARAWALLMAAENIVNKDEIKLLDEENIELVDEINSLLPKASIYDKQSSGFRDYNEGSAARKKEKEKIIWKWAVQIKRERLPEKIKSSQVINIIEKRIRNAEFPLDEIEDVRVKRTEKNPYGIPAMKNILIGFR